MDRVIPITEQYGFVDHRGEAITQVVVHAGGEVTVSTSSSSDRGDPIGLLPSRLFKLLKPIIDYKQSDAALESKEDESVLVRERTKGYNPKTEENFRLMYEHHMPPKYFDRVLSEDDYDRMSPTTYREVQRALQEEKDRRRSEKNAEYRQALSTKYLSNLPANTDIKGSLSWSSWGGQLAMVDGPSYVGSGLADESWFNAAQQARRYVVRFATDDRGKRIKVPDSQMIGSEIVVQDRRAPYHNTLWSWRRSGTFPWITGRFERNTQEYLVGVKLKDLNLAEVHSMLKLYDNYGYIDLTGQQAKIGDVKKVFAKQKFVDTQNMNPDLANLAYEMVRIKNGYRDTDDDLSDQIMWDAIQGAYRANNKRDRIMFLVKK